MTICEKVCNIINKKINSELIYNKNYLEAVKRFNTKESFQYFYIAVILFDSVYRKDRNYYSKAFLEKFIINLFWRTLRNFYFWDFESSSWNIRNFFRGFRFRRYKKSFLLKKYMEYFWAIHFLKYKNSFLLRKYQS